MRLVNLYAPNDYRIDQVERPTVGPRDALLKVEYCGICGSDVGYVAQGGLAGPTGEPMPLGHELSATLAEAGSELQGFSPGDRVCVNPMGGGNAIGNGGTEGGFTDYLLVRNAADGGCLYKLPDSVSMRDGALVEPLSVGMHAVNRARPQPGQKAVIFGVGPIGLSCIAALKYHGIEDIVAVDFSEQRRERALAMGATVAWQPDINLLHALGEQHGEDILLGMLPVVGTDIFIDAAGAPGITKSVLDVCKLGACLVVAGLHKQPVEVDMMMLLTKELSIIGSMAYPDEFPQVLDMITQSKLDLAPMVSHTVALDNFDSGFKLACSPEAGAKVLVEVGA